MRTVVPYLFASLCMSASLASAAPQSPESLSAGTLLPLESRQSEFVITQGSDRGSHVQHSLEPAPNGDGWLLTLEGYNQLHLRKADDGTVLITAIDLPERNQRIVYDPPVPLLPATVKAGQTYDAQSDVEIRNLQTGEVQHSGPADHHIDLLRRTQFDLPQGKTEGYLLEVSQRIDLSVADLELKLVTGLVPQQGAVYRDLQYTVETLGLFGDTTSRTAIITKPPRRG